MSVQKKRRPAHQTRLVLALIILVALVCLFMATRWLQTPVEAPVEAAQPQEVTLASYAQDDVTALTITRRGEPTWTVRRGADGLFALDGVPLSEATTAELASAAHIIVAAQTLTEDPADYAGRLADYGLDDPEFIASIAYADGKTLTLRVGNAAGHTRAWYYMTVDGDDRLFAFERGLVEGLFVSEASLRDVEQPVLHKARIDRITLRGPDGGIQAEWTLDAAITDTDAIDHWQLTEPYVYPADATAMTGLLSSAANLRLGTWLAPATPENLTAYGFDAPRQQIELHMAPGTIAVTGTDGAVTTQDWPEATCTFLIGGAESDMIDYVRHGDSLYRCSSFTMGVFRQVNLRATMSRYLTPVALGNLTSLTIEQGDAADVYVLTRTEQVAENNALVTDEDGNVLYDVSVTRNGTPLPFEQFEAAYQQLVTVSVSGVLPEGEHSRQLPHTVFTFADRNGTAHTVALADFDALHDAVSIDGHEAFYLIKGGFQLNIE